MQTSQVYPLSLPNLTEARTIYDVITDMPPEIIAMIIDYILDKVKDDKGHIFYQRCPSSFTIEVRFGDSFLFGALNTGVPYLRAHPLTDFAHCRGFLASQSDARLLCPDTSRWPIVPDRYVVAVDFVFYPCLVAGIGFCCPTDTIFFVKQLRMPGSSFTGMLRCHSTCQQTPTFEGAVISEMTDGCTQIINGDLKLCCNRVDDRDSKDGIELTTRVGYCRKLLVSSDGTRIVMDVGDPDLQNHTRDQIVHVSAVKLKDPERWGQVFTFQGTNREKLLYIESMPLGLSTPLLIYPRAIVEASALLDDFIANGREARVCGY